MTNATIRELPLSRLHNFNNILVMDKRQCAAAIIYELVRPKRQGCLYPEFGKQRWWDKFPDCTELDLEDLCASAAKPPAFICVHSILAGQKEHDRQLLTLNERKVPFVMLCQRAFNIHENLKFEYTFITSARTSDGELDYFLTYVSPNVSQTCDEVQGALERTTGAGQLLVIEHCSGKLFFTSVEAMSAQRENMCAMVIQSRVRQWLRSRRSAAATIVRWVRHTLYRPGGAMVVALQHSWSERAKNESR